MYLVAVRRLTARNSNSNDVTASWSLAGLGNSLLGLFDKLQLHNYIIGVIFGGLVTRRLFKILSFTLEYKVKVLYYSIASRRYQWSHLRRSGHTTVI